MDIKTDSPMNQRNVSAQKQVLNLQRPHWEHMFATNPDMLGEAPSEPAQYAAELFRKEDRVNILELGGGQGRDTIFFAHKGFQVCVVDFTEGGVRAIAQKAEASGLSDYVTPICHDVRTPLPFEDESFDACYSHMLFCMAMNTRQLESLFEEAWRVLKPGGLNVYTVRNNQDAHYGAGIHRGEDLYESGGFIVHFFSRDKVEQLAKGYDLIDIDEFEEGELPRRLFRVTLRKKLGQD